MDKIFENWRNFRKKTLLQEKGVAPLDHKAILQAATKEAAKEAAKQGATRSILGLVLSRAGGILGLFWPSELADATLSPKHREAQERIARETAKKVQQSPQTVKDVIKNTDIIEFPGRKSEIFPGPWKPKTTPKPDDMPDWLWDIMVKGNKNQESQRKDPREECKEKILKSINDLARDRAVEKIIKELLDKHSENEECIEAIWDLVSALPGEFKELPKAKDDFGRIAERQEKVSEKIRLEEQRLEQQLDKCKMVYPNFNRDLIPEANNTVLCKILRKILDPKMEFKYFGSMADSPGTFGDGKCWALRQTLRDMFRNNNCENILGLYDTKSTPKPTPNNTSPLFPKK